MSKEQSIAWVKGFGSWPANLILWESITQITRHTYYETLCSLSSTSKVHKCSLRVMFLPAQVYWNQLFAASAAGVDSAAPSSPLSRVQRHSGIIFKMQESTRWPKGFLHISIRRNSFSTLIFQEGTLFITQI